LAETYQRGERVERKKKLPSECLVEVVPQRDGEGRRARERLSLP
jgi:hypothetical protein